MKRKEEHPYSVAYFKYWRGLISFEELEKVIAPLIRNLAAVYARRSFELAIDDLYNIGLTAVWRALDRFEIPCSCGCRKTYSKYNRFIKHLSGRNKVTTSYFSLCNYTFKTL